MAADADVLVVGAGPAGAVAATLLARAGARVRLLDRESFPRGKLCGDSLNPGALSLLRRWQLPVDAAAATPVRGMIVTGHAHRLGRGLDALAASGAEFVGPVAAPDARSRGVEITGSYPGDVHGLVLSRRDFDAMLLAYALAAGVQFEPGVRVNAPVCAAGGRVVGVEVTAGARRVRLHAPVVIAADGRQSRIARLLGLLRTADSPRRWAIGAYAAEVDPPAERAVRGQYGEMHIRPDGYLGVAPLPDGQTNLCVVTAHVDRRLHDPAAFLLGAFRHDPLLRARTQRARLTTRVTVLGPLAVDSTGRDCDGVLTAGDAAGFIDPMTGDGLRFAVQGGEQAARAAQRVLMGGWDGVHTALRRERRRAFAGKWFVNRALRRLVASPLAVRAAATGGRLLPGVVQSLIARAGDVSLVCEPTC